MLYNPYMCSFYAPGKRSPQAPARTPPSAPCRRLSSSYQCLNSFRRSVILRSARSSHAPLLTRNASLSSHLRDGPEFESSMESMFDLLKHLSIEPTRSWRTQRLAGSVTRCHETCREMSSPPYRGAAARNMRATGQLTYRRWR